MIQITTHPFIFIVLASIMSLIDCYFTYWYLRKLDSKGMPKVHSREINPLARLYMKKFGIGAISLYISALSAQIIIWSVYSVMPQFGFMMYGTLIAVFMYHFAIYRELKKFGNDKKYWSLVKYKMTKNW